MPPPRTLPLSSPRHRRLPAVALLAALLAAGQAGVAAAHVRVRADTNTTGSFSALTFRVPNESETASTVTLRVLLPQDQPFRYVSVKPVPGWQAEMREAKLPRPVEAEGATLTKAVRTVTWTAERGAGIKPGEYQEFSLSVGPLPAPGTILLPAEQTYSDGEKVSWDEPTPTSGAEPDHPAPELAVLAAAATGATSSSSSPSASASATTPGDAVRTPDAAGPSTASAEPPNGDATARFLGGAALLVGLAALVLSLLGRRRGGSPGVG